MYYLSLIIAVTSGIFYHITLKSVNDKANPIVSLIITYIVALILSILIFILDKNSINLIKELKQINWASYLLGFTIVGLETGLLLAYRYGWNIGKLCLINNIIIAIILIPIGLLLFKESLSIKTIIGILISISGIIILKL